MKAGGFLFGILYESLLSGKNDELKDTKLQRVSTEDFKKGFSGFCLKKCPIAFITNFLGKMDSKHLKTKAIYYWIRQFYEQTSYDRTSRHIDEFSKHDSRNLSRRYWINYALELYSLANSYIEKKKYNINVQLCIYINIGIENIDNIQEWNNAYIKKEWTPPELYLYKNPIAENFVNQPKRSENLSRVFHRDVYYSELDKEVYGQGLFCLYM